MMNETDGTDHVVSYQEQLTLSVRQNIPLVVPLTASLNINYWCNSKCEYCWIWKHSVVNTPLEDLKLAVDELSELGVYLISLAGGEPFLHHELPQVVSHIRTRGVMSLLITNGLTLKPNRFIPVLDAGLNSLLLSLDTVDPDIYKAVRGVWLDPVLQGLKDILQERRNYPHLTVSVNCVISKANIDYLINLVEYCSEIGISVGFQPLHPTVASGHEPQGLTFSEEELLYLHTVVEKLIQMKKDGYLINSSMAYLKGFPDFLVYRRLPDGFECTAGFTTIAIDHELNVKSCWPMNPVGSLHTDKLTELWYSDVYNQRRSSMLKVDCPKCWLRCHTEHNSEPEVRTHF